MRGALRHSDKWSSGAAGAASDRGLSDSDLTELFPSLAPSFSCQDICSISPPQGFAKALPTGRVACLPESAAEQTCDDVVQVVRIS